MPFSGLHSFNSDAVFSQMVSLSWEISQRMIVISRLPIPGSWNMTISSLFPNSDKEKIPHVKESIYWGPALGYHQ